MRGDRELLLGSFGPRGDVGLVLPALKGDGAAVYAPQQVTRLELSKVLADALRADAEKVCQSGAFDALLGVQQAKDLGLPLVGEPGPILVARGHRAAR